MYLHHSIKLCTMIIYLIWCKCLFNAKKHQPVHYCGHNSCSQSLWTLVLPDVGHVSRFHMVEAAVTDLDHR